ncbi:hypothetical protein FP2506_16369 [Fulvimarina pelagi HTCC2506]|uniref:Uncharacterized protein n=1 Tax=Fulvimarina pelagi HTCC2506 TaxID=314231 RepID=Q0G0H2_9HYPH|nr:hypothetical protein FP2506_02804 [Fulvimarina pelagi HTCC2506]EAU42025.1 hypothetical protein FP2506_16369 [Fulvimarina pelagi HTCC2506]
MSLRPARQERFGIFGLAEACSAFASRTVLGPALWLRAFLRFDRHAIDRLRRSLRNGGAYRDRTDDPLLAKQMLSQLS